MDEMPDPVAPLLGSLADGRVGVLRRRHRGAVDAGIDPPVDVDRPAAAVKHPHREVRGIRRPAPDVLPDVGRLAAAAVAGVALHAVHLDEGDRADPNRFGRAGRVHGDRADDLPLGRIPRPGNVGHELRDGRRIEVVVLGKLVGRLANEVDLELSPRGEHLHVVDHGLRLLFRKKAKGRHRRALRTVLEDPAEILPPRLRPAGGRGELEDAIAVVAGRRVEMGPGHALPVAGRAVTGGALLRVDLHAERQMERIVARLVDLRDRRRPALGGGFARIRGGRQRHQRPGGSAVEILQVVGDLLLVLRRQIQLLGIGAERVLAFWKAGTPASGDRNHDRGPDHDRRPGDHRNHLDSHGDDSNRFVEGFFREKIFGDRGIFKTADRFYPRSPASTARAGPRPAACRHRVVT